MHTFALIFLFPVEYCCNWLSCIPNIFTINTSPGASQGGMIGVRLSRISWAREQIFFTGIRYRHFIKTTITDNYSAIGGNSLRSCSLQVDSTIHWAIQQQINQGTWINKNQEQNHFYNLLQHRPNAWTMAIKSITNFNDGRIHPLFKRRRKIENYNGSMSKSLPNRRSFPRTDDSKSVKLTWRLPWLR